MTSPHEKMKEFLEESDRIIATEGTPAISYAWLLMLPREALTQCVEELVEAAKTPRFEVTFAAWRSTAEVYAHSELYKTLAGEN